MRFSSFVRFLLLGTCLTSVVDGQSDSQERMENLAKVFEVYEEQEPGQCKTAWQTTLGVQFENMQRATSLAHHQVPEDFTAFAHTTRTKAAERGMFNVLQQKNGYDKIARQLAFTHDFLDIHTQEGTHAALREEYPEYQGDLRSLIFCDSTPLYLMSFDQRVPFPGAERTVGQLYNTTRKEYVYIWIPSIKGVSRVRKTDLPPNFRGQQNSEDHQDSDLPFPITGLLPEYLKASYCADPANRAWSLIVDRWVEYPDTTFRRAVFILCPNYFEGEHGGAISLPNQINLLHQEVNTPLDNMRPAWLSWYFIIEVTIIAKKMDSKNGQRVWLTWENTKQVKPGKSGQLKDDYDVLGDQKAITAKDCILLADWQRADPRPVISRPDLFGLVFGTHQAMPGSLSQYGFKRWARRRKYGPLESLKKPLMEAVMAAMVVEMAAMVAVLDMMTLADYFKPSTIVRKTKQTVLEIG